MGLLPLPSPFIFVAHFVGLSLDREHVTSVSNRISPLLRVVYGSRLKMSRRRQSLSYPSARYTLLDRCREFADGWTKLDRVQVLGDEICGDGHSG